MTLPPQDANRRQAARADFFRMVRWIVAIGVIMVIAALVWLARQGPLHPAVVVGTIGGVFLSITLGCGLFAAAFFSDKSGYDEEASRAQHGRDPDEQD
jgi:hypothetical protein